MYPTAAELWTGGHAREVLRPSCSDSYLRHDDKASNGSPNGSALRPTLGRARGATPPCALGSSESRQRREVGRARGTAPPCVPGSSKNRLRRAVWSRFLRFLVVLISISRPRQSARSGWGHCLTRYRRARSLASRSCYREDRARVKREPQTQRRGLVEAGTPEILDRHGDLQTDDGGGRRAVRESSARPWPKVHETLLAAA